MYWRPPSRSAGLRTPGTVLERRRIVELRGRTAPTQLARPVNLAVREEDPEDVDPDDAAPTATVPVPRHPTPVHALGDLADDWLRLATFLTAFFTAFLAGAFLAAAFRGPPDRPRPAVGKQFGSPFVGDRQHVVALAETGVGLTIGDVRPEPAILDHHGLPRGRVGAQLAQRRRGHALAAAALGLGVDLQRLFKRDVEDLVFGGQ